LLKTANFLLLRASAKPVEAASVLAASADLAAVVLDRVRVLSRKI
jgi:hypothetical protein